MWTISHIGSEQTRQVLTDSTYADGTRPPRPSEAPFGLTFHQLYAVSYALREARGDTLVISFLEEQEQLILLDFDFIFGLGRVVK